MDSAIIRRDCAEAYDVALTSLIEGSEPPTAQVDRLREALSGHVRALAAVISEGAADAAPGPLRDVVTRALTLAEEALAQPVQGSALDLMVTPQVARILLLMHEEPRVFDTSPELRALLGDVWESADAG
ncbi:MULTISPECIES: hypothetical protein [Streptomyces]|uniref:hypothetical protein n=1 Tax=Streptomyces TaxID=1883 RepID=UPI002ED56FC2|nr:hypothetical protein OG832_06255 [Streptomyces sp. NBC_00826]WTH94321.1 hypothetical protein OIC43_37435 [Streptomyces sp. NBC_00825]WTI03056.1 hypothetical protein OHA23_37415 [Streptomyces sp. NBC_00822]